MSIVDELDSFDEELTEKQKVAKIIFLFSTKIVRAVGNDNEHNGDVV